MSRHKIGEEVTIECLEDSANLGEVGIFQYRKGDTFKARIVEGSEGQILYRIYPGEQQYSFLPSQIKILDTDRASNGAFNEFTTCFEVDSADMPQALQIYLDQGIALTLLDYERYDNDVELKMELPCGSLLTVTVPRSKIKGTVRNDNVIKPKGN